MYQGSDEKRGFFKKRGCRFCIETELYVDFKNRFLLKPFLTERFKIIPRRITGNCAKHQRELAVAIKRARHLAVIPYSSVQLWEHN